MLCPMTDNRPARRTWNVAAHQVTIGDRLVAYGHARVVGIVSDNLGLVFWLDNGDDVAASPSDQIEIA